MICIFLCWLNANDVFPLAKPDDKLHKWKTVSVGNQRLQTYGRVTTLMVGAGDAKIVYLAQHHMDRIQAEKTAMLSSGKKWTVKERVLGNGFFYYNDRVEGVFQADSLKQVESSNLGFYGNLLAEAKAAVQQLVAGNPQSLQSAYATTTNRVNKAAPPAHRLTPSHGDRSGLTATRVDTHSPAHATLRKGGEPQIPQPATITDTKDARDDAAAASHCVHTFMPVSTPPKADRTPAATPPHSPLPAAPTFVATTGATQPHTKEDVDERRRDGAISPGSPLSGNNEERRPSPVHVEDDAHSSGSGLSDGGPSPEAVKEETAGERGPSPTDSTLSKSSEEEEEEEDRTESPVDSAAIRPVSPVAAPVDPVQQAIQAIESYQGVDQAIKAKLKTFFQGTDTELTIEKDIKVTIDVLARLDPAVYPTTINIPPSPAKLALEAIIPLLKNDEDTRKIKDVKLSANTIQDIQKDGRKDVWAKIQQMLTGRKSESF